MKKIGKGLRYSFTIMTHPIRGFYEMRFENQGNVVSCLLLLVLLVLAFICQEPVYRIHFQRGQPEGIQRHPANLRRGDTGLALVRGQLVHHRPDGRGGPIRGYFYGHLLRDGALHHRHFHWGDYEPFHDGGRSTFIGIVTGLGVAFTALLLFCGILTVHQFTVTKNVFSIILTVAGMAFIVFLALLFASIFDKLFSYVAGIFTEIQLRM